MKSQRFEYSIIAVLLALLICLFFYPVVFGEQTLFPVFPGVLPDGPYGYQGERVVNSADPTALLWFEMPGTIFASEAIKSGQLPLWNPYAGGGTSLSANLIVGLYNPLKAFLLIAPTPGMFNFYLLLRLFLAGFFTYIFLRKIDLSKTAAAAGAAVFMFSGHFVCYLTLWHLNTDFLIPLLLYLFECVARGEKKRYLVFSMLGVSLILSAGSPQSAALALTLACFYYGLRSIVLNKTDFNGITVFRKALTLLLILFGGLFLCSVMFADFYQLFSLGKHQVNTYQDLFSVRLNQYSLWSLISFLFSPHQLVGSSVGADLPNLSRFAKIAVFPYLGIIPVLLAAMAIGKNPKTNRLGFFFAGFAVLVLVNVLGGTVLLNKMIGGLITPFTNLFWAKYLGTLVFSVAVLAALGFENILKKSISPLRAGLLIGSIAVFIAACYFFDSAAYQKFFEAGATDLFLPGSLLFPGNFPLTFRAFVIAAFFLSAVSLIYKLNMTGLGFLLFIMLFGEMYIYHQPLYALRHDPYAKPPYIDYLLKRKSQEPPFRICGGAAPQISSVFGLEDISNIDAVYVKRYYSFLMNLILETDIHFGVFSLTPVEPDEYKNRFMDLLNVKYIVSSNALYPLPGILDKEGEKLPTTIYFKRSFLDLHPNKSKGDAEYLDSAYSRLIVPEKGANLHFNIGTDPNQWSCNGNGVEFIIKAENNIRTEILFRKYIDPKKRKQDRKCFAERVDLNNFKGQEVNLTFSVYPGPGFDNRFDRCGFSDIELVPSAASDQKLTLVYNNETRIYRNNTVMPRAFVVHRAESIRSKEAIFNRLRDTNFNFRERIIVEETLPEDMLECKGSPLKDGSSVTIKSYTPNRIVLESAMQHDGFLVLADTYYPRWRAYIDGQETEIYPADYMLRAVYLTSGNHEVIFAYDALPFKSLMNR